MKTNRLAIIFVVLLILLLIASGLTNPVLQPIKTTSLTEKDGFWSLEFSGDRYYRWTKGDTLFQLSGFETASSLYVILNLTAPQYPGATPIDAWMQIDSSPAIRFSIAPEWRRYYILTSVAEPRWHTPLLKLVTDTWTPGIHDPRQLGVAVSGGTIQRINSPRIFAVLERALFLAVLIAFFYTTVRYLQPYGSLLTVFAIVILGVIGIWAPSRLAQVLPTNWSLVSEILVAAVAIEVVRLRRQMPSNLLPATIMSGIVVGILLVSILRWFIAGIALLGCSVLLLLFSIRVRSIRIQLVPTIEVLVPSILTLCFLFFSIFTLMYWWQNQRYWVIGDEPHYLVMADGIINYSSFELTNPYQKEFVEKNYFDFRSERHAIVGPNGLYSIHGIGLPLLISAPYKLGSIMRDFLPQSIVQKFLPHIAHYNVYGVGAVKIFLILIAGFIVIGAWILSGFYSGDVKIRTISVVAVVFGYPFIPASNQIYPEFMAGIILLFAIIFLIAKEINGDQYKTFWLILLCLAVSFLPWLHIKLTTSAVISASALTFSIWKSKRKILHALQPLIFLAFSFILLAAYNNYAFGNIFGPYKKDALQISATSLMVWLGLHFDRFHGMFFQNPSFIIIMFFLISFFRRHPFVSLVIFATYISIVAPNALHPNWYGGRSFAGRFQWSGTIVLIPIVIYSLSKLIRQYPKNGFLFASFVVVVNIIIYYYCTFSDFDLYNKKRVHVLAYQSFIPWISDFLPALYDTTWAYSYPVNYVWAMIVLFTISTMLVYGLDVQGRFPLIYMKYGYSLLVISLIVVSVYCRTNLINMPVRYFYVANQLPSQIGQLIGADRVITDNVKNSGFLSFGPYVYLPPGDYVATFVYTSSTTPETNIGFVDVCTNVGRNILISKRVYGTNGVPSYIEIPFTLKDIQLIEVRFWYNGNGEGIISLESLEIRSN